MRQESCNSSSFDCVPHRTKTNSTKKHTYLGRAVEGQEKHPECSLGPYTETLEQPNPAIVTLRNYVNCPSHKLWYNSCADTWKRQEESSPSIQTYAAAAMAKTSRNRMKMKVSKLLAVTLFTPKRIVRSNFPWEEQPSVQEAISAACSGLLQICMKPNFKVTLWYAGARAWNLFPVLWTS